MDFDREIREHYLRGHEKFLRHISIDCVVFGFFNNELRVLLLHAKYAGHWALPGGFILKEEHMDAAANRILAERTGLEKIYMQQFYVFSEPARSTRKVNQQFLQNVGISYDESWMFERFISIGYTALVNFSKVQPVADVFSSACEWFNIHAIPELILDHREILDKALESLRTQINYHPIGFNLLPEKFTMPELQRLYETILDRKLDRRNFQRKIIGTGILKKLKETKPGVRHKAPFYYKFDLKKYQRALKGGMGFES